MKVLSLREVGDIRLEEREVPNIGDDEVLLEVKACGICSSDEDRIFKTGTYHFPTVPGHEFAGMIAKTGRNVDPALQGRKASVFPLLPCFSCKSCSNREYATCENYKYFGSRNDGAFAEYLAVPAWNLNLLDDSVSYEIGALSEPAAVAHHALTVAGVREGHNVIVIGTGTIGILMAGMCAIRGVNVVVIGRRQESVDFVRSFGLDAATLDDFDNDHPAFDADIVFEGVGTNSTMQTAIQLVRPNGTVVAVGNPKGDFFLERNIYWKILRKQLVVKGTWNSAFKSSSDDWSIVAGLMKEHDFPFERLITKTYSLEDYREAFDQLRDKTQVKSRIMFVMNREDEHGEG